MCSSVKGKRSLHTQGFMRGTTILVKLLEDFGMHEGRRIIFNNYKDDSVLIN